MYELRTHGRVGAQDRNVEVFLHPTVSVHECTLKFVLNHAYIIQVAEQSAVISVI